ncbi:MAG: methyltransferase domain-containing protein [Saprospiraceae bacterium]
MDKNYYKEYYGLERKHWWFVARGEILMDHLRAVMKERSHIRILNIGAATGRSSELLETIGKVISIEYDQACYDFTKEKLNIELINASILDLPFEEEAFDLVCAFDVIEHVEDDELAVSEMKRVCKKGGIICVTVPAFMFLWSAHDEVNHHYRRYTKKQLKQLFEQDSQMVFHSYFNFWLFFPIAFFRVLTSKFSKQSENREDAGSDFFVMNNGLVDKILYQIFRSERFFIRNRITLPVGVSLISTWKK